MDVRRGSWRVLIAIVVLLTMLGAAIVHAGTPQIRTAKDLYAPGEPIEILFDGMSSASRDWVALANCNQADRHTRAFSYVRGAASGRVELRNPGPGEYEARAYRGGTHEVRARHPFVVARQLPDATLRASKATYTPGEPVELVFDGMPGHVKDRLVLVRQGSDEELPGQQHHLREATSGTASFRGLKPGAYEARLYQEGGCRVLARLNFTVAETAQIAEQQAAPPAAAGSRPAGEGAGAPPDAARGQAAAPTLSLAAERIFAGEEIVLRFSNAPGNTRDWIAVAEPDQGPRQHRRWTWLHGRTAGEHRFPGLPAGDYELRLFVNGGYDVVVATPFRIEPPPEQVAQNEQPRPEPAPARPAPSPRGRAPVALTPEPTSRGPLTGVWEAELSCKDAATPARLRVALIHFGDTTVRAEVTFVATGADGRQTRARYHAYGSTRVGQAQRGGAWHPLHHVELDPAGWIEQPEGMRFGSKVTAYESEPGTKRLNAEIGGFEGCRRSTTLVRVSSEEPALSSPPADMAARLEHLRYPARRSDRHWSVPAATLFPELAGSPFGEAADNAARCAVLVRWLARLPAEYPEPHRIDGATDDTRRANTRKLFTDPTFVPVFGRPVDRLSEPARRFIATGSLDHCGRAAAGVDQWLQVLLRQGLHLVPKEVAQVDAVARAHREALTRRAEAIAALEALPTEAASHAAMLDGARRAAAGLDPLWPSERAPFDDALERTHRRLAETTLLARLDESVRTSENLAGAQALAGFRAANAALLERVPEARAREVTGRIEARLDQVLQVAARAELDALAARGAGLGAIAAGNTWYGSFTKRYAGFLERAPVKAGLASFQKMRAEDLARAEAALLAAVQAARSIDEVLDLQASQLAVPGDWETATGQTLRAALRDRRAMLYAALERSNARVWPLSEHSPYEESLMDAAGRLRVPASYPEPQAHEILLAVVRAVASYSGQRLGGNTVRYKLPSLKQAVLAAPQINPAHVFNMPDIDLPVFARIEFQRARKLGCRPGDARGYVCRYELASHVDSGLFASGGSKVVEDHFVLGPSGWVATTISQRLAGAGLQSWGILADGFVQGFNRAACLRALPGDPRCERWR